ncbi:MAG: transcriptional repressor [Burkholderiaceae bacterium]|jgi:Fur family ferric uptake transcriptional regulator|nr:transcriptional repressor [Burkholderiaceae bacterium]
MERITKQGTAILNAIEKAKRPLLAQEIQETAANDSPGLGQATVYRNIKALVEAGLLSTVHLPGENPRYEVSHLHHHHHFHCSLCGKVYDVHDCPGDLKQLAPAGFQVERHEVTLYGSCAACLEKN